MKGKKFFYWLGQMEAKNFHNYPSAIEWGNKPLWALTAKRQGWMNYNCNRVNQLAKKIVFK